MYEINFHSSLTPYDEYQGKIRVKLIGKKLNSK